MFILDILLLEAREDFIAKQMGQKLMMAFQRDTGKKPDVSKINPLVITQYLSSIDPKSLQWIARQYVNGQFLWEDAPQLKMDLAKFKQLVKANAIDKRDINAYGTISEFRQAIHAKNVAGAEYKGKLEKLYQTLDRSVKSGTGKWLYNNPQDPIKIYIPVNETGSVCIRKGYPDIGWCTTYEDDIENIIDQVIQDSLQQAIEDNFYGNKSKTSIMDPDEFEEKLADEIREKILDGDIDIEDYKENMHDYYLKQYGGEYYVILTPDGPFQFHFESNQFKDENDNDINFNQFVSKYPTVKKILSPIITKIGHPHFIPAKTREQITKAIKASLHNIERVDPKELTVSDWVDIAAHIIDQQAKFDNTHIMKHPTSIFRNIFTKMKIAGVSQDDIIDVFSEILKLYKYKIRRYDFPQEILDKIPRNIAKDTLLGYV